MPEERHRHCSITANSPVAVGMFQAELAFAIASEAVEIAAAWLHIPLERLLHQQGSFEPSAML